MRWGTIGGLSATIVLYLCAGAAILLSLEAPRQRETCATSSERLRAAFVAFEDVSLDRGRVPRRGDLRRLIELVKSAASDGVRMKDEMKPECDPLRWTYSTSFFFIVTMITTIGYGNVAPATAAGKAFCVAFAFFGIPMFGVVLLGVGNKVARRMRNFTDGFIASRLDPDFVEGKTRLVRASSQTAVLAGSVSFIVFFFLLLPSGIVAPAEGWRYDETFYFSYVTLTTIGLGDFVAGDADGRHAVAHAIYMIFLYSWIVFGLAAMSLLVSVVADFFAIEHLLASALAERNWVSLRERSVSSALTSAAAETTPRSEDGDEREVG